MYQEHMSHLTSSRFPNMEVITTSSFPGFVFTWHSGVLASCTLLRRLMCSSMYI